MGKYRLVLLLTMLCVLTVSPVVYSSHDEPGDRRIVLFKYSFEIPQDKQKHLLAGLGIAALSHRLGLENQLFPVITAGVGKEVYDHFFGGTVDWLDALVTAVGGLLYYPLIETADGGS